MALEVLKINRIQMAQREATIPIRAIRLFPVKRLSKSSWVILKTTKPKAKASNMYIIVFIFLIFSHSNKHYEIF